MEDIRTEKELIAEALAVQDACNLSGVVHSWSRAMSRLWKLADELHQGTDWVNRHQVCRLFADKCRSLTGPATLDDYA